MIFYLGYVNISIALSSSSHHRGFQTCSADPAIVIEAEGNCDTKKALKALSFPLMDDDSQPSAYLQRILSAIGKWRVKMHNLVSQLDSLDMPPESVKAFLTPKVELQPFFAFNTPARQVAKIIIVHLSSRIQFPG